MAGFGFNSVRAMHCEPLAAQMLAQRAEALYRALGYTQALQRLTIVTDQGIARAGLLRPIQQALSASGLAAHVFDQTEADPSDRTVLTAAKAALDHGSQLIVGLGGGSAMDVAKLVSVLAHPQTTQPLAAMYAVDQISAQRLPLIQIPTTAGTGSETTAIAIVTTGTTTKSGVVSPVLLADLAILDATLTLELPPAVTAATGIDAMVHAIEAYTSIHKKNPLSDQLARQALQLLGGAIEEAVHNGQNLEARQDMLLGAYLAGQAFANAPVAAVHALAYPLGGHFHVPHGLSNAMVLPHVLRFNAADPESDRALKWYGELAGAMGQPPLSDLTAQVDAWIEGLAGLGARLGLASRLRECGVQEGDLDLLASEAMKQQRLLINNPRSMTEQAARAIYAAAL